MGDGHHRRVASLRTVDDFREALDGLGIAGDLAFDEVVESGPDSPLAATMDWRGHAIGNRFAILPMEGWDGTEDGKPTDLTIRRWEHFGISGAKLIWGGEAAAVRFDGRANAEPTGHRRRELSRRSRPSASDWSRPTTRGSEGMMTSWSGSN